MGQFVEPEDMMTRLTPAAKNFVGEFDTPMLDDLLIVPAERLIAEECNLNLDTNGIPWGWEGRFQSTTDGAQQLQRYLDDYSRCVYLTVNRMALMLHGEVSRSVQGASVQYGTNMLHPAVKAIMIRWTQPHRWYRA